MTTLIDDLAADLARDVMEYVSVTGDDDLIRDVTKVIADRSQTFEEAFIIAIRVLQAERSARKIIDDRIRRLPAPAPTVQDRAAESLARRRREEER